MIDMHLTITEVTLASVAVAAGTARSTYLASKRDRRRRLYGEAVQSVLKWNEMLYRVRRRGSEQTRELIEAFHELQEELDYYQAWIATESPYLERSYARLVKSVKMEVEPLITAAWNELREPPGNGRPGDAHPNPKMEVGRFMIDVRRHLSPCFVRRLQLAYANRGNAP